MVGGNDLGTDDLRGGAGNDTLQGSYGSNVLRGDEGDDVIYDNGTLSTINGGTGSDITIHNENGVSNISDDGGAEDVLYFSSTLAADFRFAIQSNDLIITTASDYNDGSGSYEKAAILKGYFQSADHIEYVLDNQGNGYYLPDIFA